MKPLTDNINYKVRLLGAIYLDPSSSLKLYNNQLVTNSFYSLNGIR